MNENQNIRINVILKKLHVMHPQTNVIKSVSENPMKMTRLFDLNELVDKQNQSSVMKLKNNQKAQVFQTTYDKLDEEEKRLYRIWQIEVLPGSDLEEIMARLKEDPNIESVELNQLNELYLCPNDPKYGELYGLKKIQCELAWDISKGEDIIVAVVDTGVDYHHPDIKENMWKDVNGNYGKDFSDNDNDPMDYHGHGTHVAGTIAAVGDNYTGIIGVAPKVKIMAVKIFPKALDDVAAMALKYAVDNGAKVINNSWGPMGRRPSSPIIEAAIDYAHAKGVICVFAAGNSNDETKYYSPANYSKTISVAATDQNDSRPWFSNFGDKTDLAAPGKDILSLRFGTQNYVEMNGTSMACPHVAGACALLLSKSPSLNFQAVKDKLTISSDQISTDQVIGGRLNVNKLLL